MAVSLTSRVAWLVPALLIVEACASGDRPTAPRPGPEFAISDGVHEGGTPGFSSLPPMVAQPPFSGPFDADTTTLNPAIAICDITNGPDANCGSSGGTPAVIVFTTTTTPAITLDPTIPQYQVNWDTQGAGDRKSTRLNSSHLVISYAVFCLKKKKRGPTAHTPT